MADHPTFPNPTITEALCEIRFALPADIEWNSASYGQLFTRIQEDFPTIEPVAGVPIRMRYRHRDRPLLIQLSENVLTVNQLPVYSGWAQMKSDVTSAWTWLREIIGPVQIAQVGLRYINIIPEVAGDERMIDWLAPNRYVSDAVLETRRSSSVCDVWLADSRKALIRVGEVTQLQNTEERGFVLDIDAVAHGGVGEHPNLNTLIDSLHDVVWRVFDSFLTPRFNEFLNRGQ